MNSLDERRLFGILESLLAELNSHRERLSLGSDLERDLGLGSLERAEFLVRVEDSFSVNLPDNAIVQLKNLRHILEAVTFARKQGTTEEPKAFSLSQEQHFDAEGDPTWRVPGEDEVKTLVDVARYRAEHNGSQPHIRFLQDNGEYLPLSYQQLWTKALQVASGLSTLGLKRGDRVSLILPSGEDFFVAFLGILCADAVPVPIYPPIRMDQLNAYLDRHSRILSNAGVAAVVSDKQLLPVAKLLQDRVHTLREAVTVSSLNRGEVFGATQIDPASLGLIQYTSGSTGDPKGVALSHQNLMVNIRDIGTALELGPKDVNITWLPLYHDMGLIGSWMSALLHATPIVLLTPLQFLSKPERWLWAIHHFRGTVAPAPNFGFDLACRKVRVDKLEGLDLSSWKIAINGSEPVLPETIDRFCEKFGPFGFQRSTMFPVYGMAETCLGLTTPPRGREPRIDVIERESFVVDNKAIPLKEAEGPSLSFVSVGKPMATQKIKVVDPENPDKLVEERVEGRILMRGPAIMDGYFQQPESTAQIRFGEWTDTGDLGYLADGELYITGRVKDLVIKGGRNYHPHDIEHATCTVEGIRKGCVIAFAAPSKMTGESIVVVAETREKPKRFDEIKSNVVAAVQEAIGAPCDEVVLVPPGTVPKTSSGKLRRRETRAAYLDGSLRKPKRVWTGLLKLLFSTAFARTKKTIRATGRLLFSCWTALVGLGVLVVAILCILLFSRSQKMAWNISQIGCKMMFWLTGIPVKHIGPELPEGKGIVVCNHMSYLDQFFLVSQLKRPLIFAIKSEPFSWPLFGRLIKRLGCIPVDRSSSKTFLESYQSSLEALDNGELVLIFPEGTFTAATGVRPFRLGAFNLAVEKQVPIIPVALHGARDVQRGDSFWLHWARVKVITFEPITPSKEQSLQEVARLRDQTRQLLAEASEEPLLDVVSAALPDIPKSAEAE